jgi:hypothetical protein
VKTLFLLIGSLLLTTVAMGATRTVHVFVALADNKHQGIVPVSAALGDGTDARNNLYWGAMYGLKTWLSKDANWTLVSSAKSPTKTVLERCVFTHAQSDLLLVADAYRGSEIKTALTQFVSAAAGHGGGVISVGAKKAATGGSADLVVYVGHNGLMEFDIPRVEVAPDNDGRGAIVLACKSRPYFEKRFTRLKTKSVLLTTGLMAPEAYTLVAALEGWRLGAGSEAVRERAAAAYHKYQKCGINGARRLFYSEKQEGESK